MPVYTGISGNTYSAPDTPFAGGGEGNIYDVTGNRELVAKIYNPDKRTTGRERKLMNMLTIKPSVAEQYAWPCDVLYENGAFAGYVMPKVTGKEKLRNLYVYDNRDGIPWTLYIAIAKNLAAAVHNIHEIGQVIGDLNPENILVDPHTGLVTLVDTDSYHITDMRKTVYRCEVGMPEFVAPELQGKHFPSESLPTFTQESDRFSLSILIFALLMNGSHPFACKVISGSASQFQPIDNMVSGICAYFTESSTSNLKIPRYAPELSSLPGETQTLFRRAFIDGHKKPSRRPTAKEWYDALEKMESNIKVCGTNSEHLYYYHAAECPWCHVEQKMRSIPQMAFSGGASPRAAPQTYNPGVYTYMPQPQKQSKKPFVYWLITLVLSAPIAWFLAAYIAPMFFLGDSDMMFLEDIINGLDNISSYAIFLGGLAGLIGYNVNFLEKYGIKDYVVSPLASAAGAVAVGVCMFLLKIAIIIVSAILLLFVAGMVLRASKHDD